MKVNEAGVMPVIFASSVLYIPTLAAQLFGNRTHPQGWVAWTARYIEQSSSALYMLAFFVLIVGFTYFYVSITFNPTEVADNMKKYGGCIPPRQPPAHTTADHHCMPRPPHPPRAAHHGGIAPLPPAGG